MLVRRRLLELTQFLPPLNVFLDRKRLSVLRVLRFEFIRLLFERNLLVAAAAQESPDIEFGEPRQAKMPVLNGMHQFVEEK